jgi:hypothetical protein
MIASVGGRGKYHIGGTANYFGVGVGIEKVLFDPDTDPDTDTDSDPDPDLLERSL